MELVELSVDDSGQWLAAITRAAGDFSAWTAEVSASGAGTHELRVRARDAALKVFATLAMRMVETRSVSRRRCRCRRDRGRSAAPGGQGVGVLRVVASRLVD